MLASVVNLQDMRVVQAREASDFLDKALPEAPVVKLGGIREFDDDLAVVQLQIVGELGAAHAATTESPIDEIATR
jgi:hypothetical protein